MGQSQSIDEEKQDGIQNEREKQRRNLLRFVEPEITEFVDAASKGIVEKVTSGLQYLNAVDGSGDTALLAASQQGQIEIVHILLKQGNALQLNCKDFEGANALMLASSAGEVGIVQLLLDAKIRIDCSDSNGWQACHHAAASGHCDVLSCLKDRGVDGLESGDRLGWTPLHIAAHEGQRDCVEWLMLNGSNPLLQDLEGNTAKVQADSEDLRTMLASAETIWENYGETANETEIRKLLGKKHC